ncbi:hypothetical protein JCM8097_001617 [Rhodosporidiobolus ruineniae]
MRTAAFASLALSTLALFASANPEPCSDHPGVVHAPGTFGTDPVVQQVAKVVKLKSPSSSQAKSKASSSKTKAASKAVAIVASPAGKAAAAAASPASSSLKAKATKSSSGAWSKSTKAVKKKATPKVKDSNAKTVTSGAAKAISGFSNSSYIPAAVAQNLTSAISSAIDQQLAGKATTVTHTSTSTVLATQTANVTRTETVANSTIFVPQPTTFVQTYTAHVTDVVTLITTSDAVAASLDIQKALQEAFAAANLSQSGLDAATTASLEACLATVMSSGGMPDGYSCLTQTGSDSAGLTDTLNNILEQFVGILPNKILESVFDSVTPLLSTLLPASEQALVAQIQSSIQSVIASLSGNSVTALEQISSCYSEAIQQQGNTSSLACFTKSGGAYSTLQTATNSVLEQFVGVLPASLISSVENILEYNLANETTPSAQLAASVSSQISNAISSVGSSLAGNTVTLAEVLQACAAQLIQTGNATAAQECITQTTAPEISMTTINSIAQQFSGYLPSSFFTDLVDYSSTLLSTSTNAHNLTQAELNSAFESFFNNQTSYGAAYVRCFNEVQACVTSAIVKSGTLDAVCAGPVDGCSSVSEKADSTRMKRRSVRRHNHAHTKRSGGKSHFGFAGRIRDVKWFRA